MNINFVQKYETIIKWKAIIITILMRELQIDFSHVSKLLIFKSILCNIHIIHC